MKKLTDCKIYLYGLIGFFMFFVSVSVNAEEHSGKILKYHLNSAVQDRGACIRTDPPLPTTSGWVCIQGPNTNLYSELTSMLLAAHMANSTCKIRWIGEYGSGHGKLTMVECTKN